MQLTDSGTGELSISKRLCLTGDPEYGVPILDPLFIKEITMKLLGLILTVRDTTAVGAKGFDLQDVR